MTTCALCRKEGEGLTNLDCCDVQYHESCLKQYNELKKQENMCPACYAFKNNMEMETLESLATSKPRHFTLRSSEQMARDAARVAEREQK
jgi:hypothetical protein